MRQMMVLVVGDADELLSKSWARCNNGNNSETNVLTRTRTNKEKKAVLVSVWLKKIIKRI
jgi:hypothetical protein